MIASTIKTTNKIEATIYGQVIGDALGL